MVTVHRESSFSYRYSSETSTRKVSVTEWVAPDSHASCSGSVSIETDYCLVVRPAGRPATGYAVSWAGTYETTGSRPSNDGSPCDGEAAR